MRPPRRPPLRTISPPSPTRDKFCGAVNGSKCGTQDDQKILPPVGPRPKRPRRAGSRTRAANLLGRFSSGCGLLGGMTGGRELTLKRRPCSKVSALGGAILSPGKRNPPASVPYPLSASRGTNKILSQDRIIKSSSGLTVSRRLDAPNNMACRRQVHLRFQTDRPMPPSVIRARPREAPPC